ncbi:DUF2877 domain-containing protein [Nocardioides sp. cx-173]|uniref:oxamate carbamoyltransferase subunit AllH family protein n=1 Tax=Nocardioides sp. cx-173 TaxID=2898796 RepID=UPI001E2B700F|nr:DUF2877 domain-containing protein [Nocardioides sp. cx-173]MCD4525408.1 DUF2877 domain-containing protein [Nocardioides sp. cx-173]UGB40797.1 DUF2877 domain-containing protein [Nocardioides sp. cx-173]
MTRPRPIPAAAPARVAARLRDAPDGPLPLLHTGRHAVYVALGERALGVVARHAWQVPCALRTRLPALPDVRSASVLAGVLHLDAAPVVVGRLVQTSVTVRSLRLAADRVDPAALVGGGGGLTPYGDDVLCGYLAALRAAGHPTERLDAEVMRLLPRTTVLSATLLECALRGEVLPEVAALLAAWGTPAAAAAEAALLRVGSSSGAGLLEGARLALAA